MKTNRAGICNKIAAIKLNGRKVSVSETATNAKGAFTYTDQNGKVCMVIDKSLGTIGAQGQVHAGPKLPLTTARPPSAHEKKIINSKNDLLGRGVLAQKGDPSYEKVVDLLPPLGFPYTFLGDKEYRHQPAPRIDWDGSIRGCLGFGLNGKPLDWTQGDQQRVQHGLLDGYLPAIQFVYVNEKAQIGWEEIAMAKAYPEHDDALLVFIRLKVRNLSRKSRQENISIFFTHFTQISGTDHDGQYVDTTILKRSFYPDFNGSAVEQPEYLWVSEENDYAKGAVYPFCNINRPCQLRGGEEKSLYLIAAYPQSLKQGTFKRLVPGLNFYRTLYEIKKDWDRFLAKGMQIETPESRVNHACKASLIQGFMTVTGSDVKYAAAGMYANESFRTLLNGLPIAIIHPAECFAEWGHLEEVKRYLTYYLKHYIKPDGSASYTGGTGGYDYGLLLYALSRYYRLNNKDTAWARQNIVPIKNICDFIIRKRNEGLKLHPAGSLLHGLIGMLSCDDLRSLGDKFYNYATDACCWLGLREAGRMLVEAGIKTASKSMVADGKGIIKFAEAYKKDILTSLKKSIDHTARPVFVPIYPGNKKPFPTLTDDAQSGIASFANFGFYLFLLYSKLLDDDIAAAIIKFREKRGGEVLGTSRFGGSADPHGPRMDDWPIASLGWALINLDMTKKFLLTYYGDLAHHRMRDVFTAYEQVGIVDIGGGRKITAGYNICSTLAIPRMTKYMLVFEERDKDLIWLNRAAPETWLADGKKTIVKDAPTRWGKISYWIESHISKNYISAQIDFAGAAGTALALNLRLRHPGHKHIRSVSLNGKAWRGMDKNKQIINIPCPQKGKINIAVHY